MTQINILLIDATNQVFENRHDFKAKAVNGESIRNTHANKLFAENQYTKIGGYALGNEQDIRLLGDKMLLFVDRLKKFVTIGIKAQAL